MKAKVESKYQLCAGNVGVVEVVKGPFENASIRKVLTSSYCETCLPFGSTAFADSSNAPCWLTLRGECAHWSLLRCPFPRPQRSYKSFSHHHARRTRGMPKRSPDDLLGAMDSIFTKQHDCIVHVVVIGAAKRTMPLRARTHWPSLAGGERSETLREKHHGSR